MQNGECRMQNAEWRMRNAECGMRNAECGMRNAERGMRNAECGMRNAEVTTLDGILQCGNTNAAVLAEALLENPGRWVLRCDGNCTVEGRAVRLSCVRWRASGSGMPEISSISCSHQDVLSDRQQDGLHARSLVRAISEREIQRLTVPVRPGCRLAPCSLRETWRPDWLRIMTSNLDDLFLPFGQDV